MHKLFTLAILIGFSVSNSVLASATAEDTLYKESISWEDLPKAVPSDSYGTIFDVVVLSDSDSIESKLIFEVPSCSIDSRKTDGREYRKDVNSMVKHYNDKSIKGKAIVRHCYERNRHHYWDIIYYHCDSQKETFQNLLRTYVSTISTGKGRLLGGLPVCAYEVYIDIPTGNQQLGLAMLPILGWVANSLLHHVGMVVQADNGKWYAMQKENNGSNTMAEYNSFAEAKDRIYHTCKAGTCGREWYPCSPPTSIPKNALIKFNEEYNSSYDVLDNNCKDYVSEFKKKFNLTGISVDCRHSDGSWHHMCSCKRN